MKAKSTNAIHNVAAKWLLQTRDVTGYQVGKGRCCRSTGAESIAAHHKAATSRRDSSPSATALSPFAVLSCPPTMPAPVLYWHKQLHGCWAKQLKNDFAKRWVICHPSKYGDPVRPVLHKWLCWCNWWADQKQKQMLKMDLGGNMDWLSR